MNSHLNVFILSALLEDKYNYITATYYLLAERILRRSSSTNSQYDQGYTNYKNKNQPSKGSLNKNQTQQQPQQQNQQQIQKIMKASTNSNKRKFSSNSGIMVSEFDSHEELNEEEESSSNRKQSNRRVMVDNENKLNGEKSPLKVKIFDFESQELTVVRKNSGGGDTNLIDCEDDVYSVEDLDTNNSNNMPSTGNSSNNKRIGRIDSNQRELLSFTIPEEAEEMNTIESNKEK